MRRERSTTSIALRVITITRSSFTQLLSRWKGNELTVHDASQAVVQTAWTLAQVFGIEEKQVHVTSPYVGGGFGSKTLWHHHHAGCRGRESWPDDRSTDFVT